jgi:hypothetical protein
MSLRKRGKATEVADPRPEPRAGGDWYRTAIGRAQLMDLQALFVTVFHSLEGERSQERRMLAMFATDAIAVDSRFYYFTPDTARLAPQFLRVARAQPCPRPTEHVTFQFGDEAARQAFRERRL